MTINYTTLLGLAQPVTGTEQGTWGDTVNTEITALLEDAVAKGVTINVTSGDVTLTSTAGTSNQARNAILLITGTPGVSRNVIAPSSSKVYIIVNGSNAAVVIKGAATTGVTVATGATSLVAWNGSDFVEVGQAGDVDGPASSTANAIARFSGTTGKIIQNSGITIDASNNVSGMGTLGVGAITTTGVFTATAGTVSAPAITTTGDTNTGIFFPAADTIAFTEGGVEAMRIDSSGNVGIGVTPSAWANGSALQFGTGATSYYGYSKYGMSANAYFNGSNWKYAYNGYASLYQPNPATGEVYWFQGPLGTAGNNISLTQAMTLDASGNLGIGTTSPSAVLDIDKAAALMMRIKRTSVAGEFQLYQGTNVVYLDSAAASGNLAFATVGTERMRIDSSGNVGIGLTPIANTRLSIRTATTTDTAIYCDNTTNADFQVKFASGLTTITQGFNAPLAFATNNTERMRIDSSGNVSVNTTSAPSKFNVYGDIAVGLTSENLGINFGPTGNTARIQYNGNGNFEIAPRSGYSTVFLSGPAGSERMRIDSSGNVGIGTSSPVRQLQVGTFASGSGEIVLASSTAGYGSVLFGDGSTGTDVYRGYLQYQHVGDFMLLGTASTERMRIDSSGNVGIGMSTPGVRLHMSGGGLALVSTTHYYNYVGGSGTAGENTLIGYFTGTGVGGMISGDAVGGVENNLTFCGYSGSAWGERMRLRGGGDLLIGYTTSNGSYKLQVNSQIFATNATIATSDGRYKENVESLTNALDIVCNLNPVQFKWKKHLVHNFDTETVAVGFIAQEVQEVLNDKPYTNSIVKSNECVLQEEQKDADGNVTTPEIKEQFYGLSDSSLIPILTKAIQELKAITDAQATRIEALEAEVAAMKGN